MSATELELLRQGLERVQRERDAAVVAVRELEAELEHLRSGKDDEAQWHAHAAAFHRAECAASDARPTPAETPRAKEVEATLRRLGTQTEGGS